MRFQQEWIICGSELSPFTLKLIALCQYKGLPYRLLPAEGGSFENAKVLLRKTLLVRGHLPLLWPQVDEKDEYPLVPFLFGPNKENLYDSSAIAQWLDRHSPCAGKNFVIPDAHTPEHFLCHLIDEFADEWGLYLVHHNRWKISAEDNTAGRRLAYELRTLLGPFQPIYASWFSRRQVRRMPYLFSVAMDSEPLAGVPLLLQPPERLGFPATHHLLEKSFDNLLAALEERLLMSPYLLGTQFTLADASIYGQLAMNLKDPTACCWIKEVSPNVYDWLRRLEVGNFAEPKNGAPRGDNGFRLDATLASLLSEICKSYVPLMSQNYAAWKAHCHRGVTEFNEAAFWKNNALFDGDIGGQPYRSVVKTFQVKTWMAVLDKWRSLAEADKHAVRELLPDADIFDRCLSELV